jgi:hypothetical protein
MVATVTVRVNYGAGPSQSVDVNGLAVRLIAAGSSDGRDQADTSNPVVIPSAGLGYSYYKHICLSIDGGTYSQIDNVQMWCDGTIGWTLGTLGQLSVGTRDAGDHGCPDASYDQAQGDGTYGYPIDDDPDGHPYYYGQTTGVQDIENFTSGAKMTVDSGAHTINERTKGVVFQVEVDTDATQGEQTDETITYSYDEQ